MSFRTHFEKCFTTSARANSDTVSQSRFSLFVTCYFVLVFACPHVLFLFSLRRACWLSWILKHWWNITSHSIIAESWLFNLVILWFLSHGGDYCCLSACTSNKLMQISHMSVLSFWFYQLKKTHLHSMWWAGKQSCTIVKLYLLVMCLVAS